MRQPFILTWVARLTLKCLFLSALEVCLYLIQILFGFLILTTF